MLGVASLAFWSLIIVICDQVPGVRDAGRQPRRGRHPGADRAGDPARGQPATGVPAACWCTLGVFGTALLYGDGVDHARRSRCSPPSRASRSPPRRSTRCVVPIVGASSSSALFVVQRRGTAAIGRVFGPIMVVWFAVLGVLGRRARSSSIPRCCGPSTRSTSSSSSSPTRWKAFLALGLDLPRRHRRRGAVRRHGPLRPAARSASAGTRWCCPAWCSTTSARRRCCIERPWPRSEPVLRDGTRVGDHRRWRCWPRWRR